MQEGIEIELNGAPHRLPDGEDQDLLCHLAAS